MKRGSNTILVHRVALALYLLSTGTVTLQQAVRDSAPPHSPLNWAWFVVCTVVGLYFYFRAACHAGGWALDTLRGWNDD